MKIWKHKNIIIPIIAAFITALIPATFITFSWYTSTSNDANANTDEIKTLTQGYGGHFSTEGQYNNFTGIYESGGNVETQAYVKPGDVLYYAFLFDVDVNEGLKGSYTLDLVLNAGGNTGTYHSTTYGNYNNFLSHLGIERNSCHLYQLQKTFDNEEQSYKYEKVGATYYTSPSFTNSEIDKFYKNSALNTSMTLTMPAIDTYPEDNEDKGYFMIYIPIWYMDTEELQNSELECYVKVSSTVITEIQS